MHSRRVEFVAAFGASAAFLLAGPPLSEAPLTLAVARALAALIVAMAAFLLIWTPLCGPAAWRRRSAEQRAFLREWLLQTVAAFAVLSTWLLAHWPGLLDWDSYTVYTHLSHHVLPDWGSSLYLLALMTLEQFVPGPGFASLVQTAFVALCAGLLCSFPSRFGVDRRLCRAALVLFLLAPLNGALTIHSSRDTPFSWLHLATALFLPMYALSGRGPRPGWKLIVGYSLLVMITAKLRVEALLIVPLILAALRESCRWRRRDIAAFLGCCVLLWSVFFRAFPAWLELKVSSWPYLMTSVVNPLSYLMRSEFWSYDRPGDIATVNRVYDHRKLLEFYDPYDLPSYRQKSMRPEATPEERSAFLATYLRLIATNPGLFLENRVPMFIALIGLAPRSFHVQDGTRFPDPRGPQLGIEPKPIAPFLAGLDYWSANAGKHAHRFAWLYGSAALSLVFLFFAMASVRFAPASAAAALVIFARLAVVFCTAPVPQFRYVYSLYLVGFFLPLYVWAELKQRKMAYLPASDSEEDSKICSSFCSSESRVNGLTM